MSHEPHFAQDSGVIATPEIVEWQVKKPSDAYVLVCSDGTLDAAKKFLCREGRQAVLHAICVRSM